MIIAPVQLQDEMINQINQLGNMSEIVALNLYHYLFLNQCKQKYANATLWATSGLQDKCPDLLIDKILSDRNTQD